MTALAQPDDCMSEGSPDCCINNDLLFLSVEPEAGFAKKPVIPCHPRESGEKAGRKRESTSIPKVPGFPLPRE